MKPDNTLTTVVFVAVLVLSILACGQYVTPAVNSSPTATPPPTRPPATAWAGTPPPTPTLTLIIPGGPTTARVLAAAVNIRSSPGGEVVGQLFAGQTVTIVECVGDWCEIVEPAGWVFAGCLSGVSDLGCENKE